MQCPKCKIINKKSARFCTVCGSPLIYTTKLTPEEINKHFHQKRKGMFIRYSLLFFLVLLIGCLTVIITQGNYSLDFIAKYITIDPSSNTTIANNLNNNIKKNDKPFFSYGTFKISNKNEPNYSQTYNVKKLSIFPSFESAKYNPSNLGIIVQNSEYNNLANDNTNDDYNQNTLTSSKSETPINNTKNDVKADLKYKFKLEWMPSKAFSCNMPVYVMYPESFDKNDTLKYPLLILLGGATGANKGFLESAEYWVNNCGILNTTQTLNKGKIHSQWSFKKKQLKEEKELLKDYPMRNIIIALPFTNNGIRDYYTNYIINELIPFMEKNYKTIPKPEYRAIDGACLGGAQSYYIAFRYPHIFGSVGGIQSDLRDFGKEIYDQLNRNIDLIRQAQRININTSNGDVYLPIIKSFHNYLDSKLVNNRFNSFIGEHGYIFYKTSGGIDSILFHNQSFSLAEKRIEDKKLAINYSSTAN